MKWVAIFCPKKRLTTYLPFGNTLLKLGQNIKLIPTILLWLRIVKN